MCKQKIIDLIVRITQGRSNNYSRKSLYHINLESKKCRLRGVFQLKGEFDVFRKDNERTNDLESQSGPFSFSPPGFTGLKDESVLHF